jgi:hypothetical protein
MTLMNWVIGILAVYAVANLSLMLNELQKINSTLGRIYGDLSGQMDSINFKLNLIRENISDGKIREGGKS